MNQQPGGGGGGGLQDKKNEYINMLQMDHQEFLEKRGQKGKRQQNLDDQQQQGCCFCFFKKNNGNSGSKRKESNRKKSQRKKNANNQDTQINLSQPKEEVGSQEEDREQPHGFSTNLHSDEWLTYFQKQLQSNFDSSSVQILNGFNWSKQLHEFVEGMREQFQVRKYRSAVFYLNYGVRQMKIEAELDGLIQRKQTQLDRKLRKLDKYPGQQNFNQNQEQLEIIQRLSTNFEEFKTAHEGGLETGTVKKSQISSHNFNESIKMSQPGSENGKAENSSGNQPSSLLSFIYDENTQRMKNIEDFGAPVTQLNRVLLSILTQIRVNLNEVDHPLNVIVTQFQNIMVKNIENLKQQLRVTLTLSQKNGPPIMPQNRALSKPNIVEVDAHTMEEERKSSTNNIKLQQQTSFKMPAGQQRHTQLLNRATYHRQTINTLPQEVKIAEILIAEVKKLVCMLYGTVVRFYIPVMRYDDIHEMREDLIELLTSLTVRGELSRVVMQLCRLCTKEEENLLTQKLQELVKIKPERIGIDRLFTLNESSKLVDLFEDQIRKTEAKSKNVDLIKKQESNNKIFEEKLIEELNELQTQNDDKEEIEAQREQDSSQMKFQEVDCLFQQEQYQKQKICQDTLLTRDILKSKINSSNKPYQSAFLNLRRVRDYETPIDKMRCITQTSRYIVQSIDTFWEGVTQMDKKKLTLDADQLLMIFIYITLRSKVNELLSHLKFINEFSTNTLRLSKLGYCILTLEVAIQQILNLDTNQLLLSNSVLSITNAEQLLGEQIQNSKNGSLMSEFPLIVQDDMFDYEGPTFDRSFQM